MIVLSALRLRPRRALSSAEAPTVSVPKPFETMENFSGRHYSAFDRTDLSGFDRTTTGFVDLCLETILSLLSQPPSRRRGLLQDMVVATRLHHKIPSRYFLWELLIRLIDHGAIFSRFLRPNLNQQLAASRWSARLEDAGGLLPFVGCIARAIGWSQQGRSPDQALEIPTVASVPPHVSSAARQPLRRPPPIRSARA